MAASIQLVLLTGSDCPLCDAMKTLLSSLKSPIAFELVELSVETYPTLKEAYWDRIPYLFVGGRPLAKGKLDPRALQLRLLAVKAGLKRGDLPQEIQAVLEG
jgi:glutaredoxin